jgi:hypothetical protein
MQKGTLAEVMAITAQSVMDLIVGMKDEEP